MPKFKKPRVAIRIDMTPMVDVAFLLLTFFMLTTQFRPPAEMEVTLPASHSQFKLPESDIMTITFGKDGRIFMGLDKQQARERVFGPEYKLRPEMEVEKANLANLIMQARGANTKLRVVIKGDKDAEYGLAEDIMDILQKTLITRFNLVTDLERD